MPDDIGQMKILAIVPSQVGQWLRVGLLAVTAGVLISCASLDVRSTQYVGVPHPPPTDPATVQILRTEPTRPHEKLGEVVVNASTDPAPPVTEIELRLRKEAARIGADAVVIVHDRIQPVGAFVSGPWWGGSVSPITGRILVGVAIKYDP